MPMVMLNMEEEEEEALVVLLHRRLQHHPIEIHSMAVATA